MYRWIAIVALSLYSAVVSVFFVGQSKLVVKEMLRVHELYCHVSKDHVRLGVEKRLDANCGDISFEPAEICAEQEQAYAKGGEP